MTSTRPAKKTPRVYLPPVSILTVVAGASFLTFGLLFVGWLFFSIHPLAGLAAGAGLSAMSYVAAQSHAASVRIPADVTTGSSFTDPEDQDGDQDW